MDYKRFHVDVRQSIESFNGKKTFDPSDYWFRLNQ